MKIQVLCFDADGVIVNPPMQFSKLLREQYGITPQMTRPFFDGIFNNCLEGQASLAGVLPEFLPEWGWKGSPEDFIRTWLAADHVIDGRLLREIRSLRSRGFPCCLTTSQERNRAEYMKTAMGFASAFDRLFFSCELGCQKPSASYYQAVQNALGLPGEAILFWDDSAQNVEGARRFGWQAEQYTDFDDFLHRMGRYLVTDKPCYR